MHIEQKQTSRAVKLSGDRKEDLERARERDVDEVVAIGYTKTHEWIGKRSNGSLVVLSAEHMDDAFDTADGVGNWRTWIEKAVWVDFVGSTDWVDFSPPGFGVGEFKN